MNKRYKIIPGPMFGDREPTPWLLRCVEAIAQSDIADTERRQAKPNQKELLAAFDRHIFNGEVLADSDARYIRDMLVGKPLPAGRPKISKNALLARDWLMYFEFGKQLAKCISPERARARAGKKFGVSGSTVEAAVTRIRKLIRP